MLRLAAGASLFGHGLVRIPKLAAFSDWMTGNFEKSMLPVQLVKPFSYVLPFAELLCGLLLCVGFFTRPALFASGLLMVVLIFGATLIENWEAIPSQLIHAAFFAILYQFAASNDWAIDNLIKK